jgi:hypothetical protein
VVPSTLSPTVKLETARTFVPGWWVNAFEAAATASSNVNIQLEIGDRGVLPRFSASELGLLALLLGDIQRQMLESDSTPEFVELDWSIAQKHLSGPDSQARDRLAHVFEGLSQIRFPVKHGEQQFRIVPLFTSETWSHVPGAPGTSKLVLKPSRFALELLTGYTDSHLDFLRRIRGEERIASIHHGQSPLVLWTPVWLELTPGEQVVYARMESAMQREGAWLRLDGLVGCSIESLTTGIKLGKKQSDDQSPLMERLRLVGKLGRRLVAHGLIQREPSSGYMAIENDQSQESPLLLWQASTERLKSRAEADFFGLASSKMLKGAITNQIDSLIAIFASISGSARSIEPLLHRIWNDISKIPGGSAILSPGIMAQSHLLFMEWISRSHPATLLPIPEVLRKSAAVKLCSSTEMNNAAQRFRDFILAFSRSDELRQFMLTNPLFSISTGTISGNITAICEDAISHLRSNAMTMESANVEKPVVERPIRSNSGPINTISVKQESSSAEKVDQQAQNLRRIAQDELDKMMRQSPNAYEDLKVKYIASLDGETKSIVLDVQRRLGSKTFDRHLKIRLVHYMVENPSSWNSVSSRFPI